jgi:hypothetical protein
VSERVRSGSTIAVRYARTCRSTSAVIPRRPSGTSSSGGLRLRRTVQKYHDEHTSYVLTKLTARLHLARRRRRRVRQWRRSDRRRAAVSRRSEGQTSINPEAPAPTKCSPCVRTTSARRGGGRLRRRAAPTPASPPRRAVASSLQPHCSYRGHCSVRSVPLTRTTTSSLRSACPRFARTFLSSPLRGRWVVLASPGPLALLGVLGLSDLLAQRARLSSGFGGLGPFLALADLSSLCSDFCVLVGAGAARLGLFCPRGLGLGLFCPR